MIARIVRTALRLVPAEWRPTVADDVLEAAAIENRGSTWTAWQAARVGARMRLALAVDSGRVDVGQALRALVRARCFTGAAILIFALGIGVNVARRGTRRLRLDRSHRAQRRVRQGRSWLMDAGS